MIWMNDSCEEELYLRNQTVIWSKGNFGKAKKIQKCFTIEAPVLEVCLFEKFTF